MLLLRVVKRLASLGIVLIAVAAVASTAVVASAPHVATFATSHEGEAADLELSSLAERSAMFAADGSFLTFLTEEQNRQEVDLEDIPQEVVDAILAVEDADFYEHDGVNLRGTFRALVENINAGGIAQGGSTITQQLVKGSLLTTEQNLSRKSTEAFYALRLERQMTKDEILERYLNSVYFGSNAYGVQAAAETYWGYDSVEDLGWAESALLAGIIRNPTQYDPTRFPNVARGRRTVALQRLVDTEHITPEEAQTYEFAPLPEERQEPFDTKPKDYFVQQALLTLLRDDPSILGGDDQSRFNAVYQGGLKIYTTFDPKAQVAALAARDAYIDESTGYTVAIATVDSKTGAVRAMVGGPEFERDKFNLTTQGLRQPGSSMKTYVLAALFEAGFNPNDVVRADGPCKFKDPTAKKGVYTVGGRFQGRQSIAAVTRASNNCAFVRLGQVVGNDKVVQASQRLGISTIGDEAGEFLSLPLGPVETKPMEMASAYAAINNDGKLNKAWYIERIEDRDGNVIYEHRPDWTRAISQQSARMITQILESNVRRGTGKNARLSDGHVAAGKTGTAQNHEDAWFVGYSEYYTTAVWLGDPDEKRTIRLPGYGTVFGGELPAKIWGDYMNVLHERLEPLAFAEPEPYGGSRYLKVKGEIDYCDFAAFAGATGGTELVDVTGDGRPDCFRPITTTTVPPTTQQTKPPKPTETTVPPPDNGGDGRGNDGADG